MTPLHPMAQLERLKESAAAAEQAGFRELKPEQPASPALQRPPRGARLPRLVDVDADVLSLLAGAVIAVIACGSIGMRIASELARLNVRGLRLIDPGRLKIESTLTYPVTPADVGRAKVVHAGQGCLAINPDLEVKVFEGRVEALDPVDFLDVDLFVVAPDLLGAEVAAGQLALLLGRPMIRASVHGDTLLAQLWTFSGSPEGACPACNLNAEEWEALDREVRYSCADLGTQAPAAVIVPTRSFGALCSLAADLAVLEVLRCLLGLPGSRRDTLLTYCGYHHGTSVSPLSRNEACPCDHRRLERVALPSGASSGALGPLSLSALLSAAGFDAAALPGITVSVDRLRFVEQARCACPGGERAVGRFLAPGAGLAACSVCGAARAESPLAARREVPGEVLAPHLDRSLASLGAPLARAFTVLGEERSVLVSSLKPACTGALL